MQSPIQSHLNNLLRDLREGATEQRQQAAKNLRDYGAAAVEPLCLALRDKDLNVRAAAAESLGHIGDARAVQALIEAWRACFIGGSARWQYMALLMVLGVAILGLVSDCLGSISTRVLAFLMWFVIVFYMAAAYVKRRSSQGKVCQAIIGTLMRIVENNPSPELRVFLPELKAVAADFKQDAQAIRMARQAAQRIETLTEQLKSLPLPAAAPVPDAATLPRAADAPAPNAETLPRVTEK